VRAHARAREAQGDWIGIGIDHSDYAARSRITGLWIADLEPVGRRSDGELGSTVLVSTCKSRAIDAQRCWRRPNGHLERPLAGGVRLASGRQRTPLLLASQSGQSD
jgi:hypothetical protein